MNGNCKILVSFYKPANNNEYEVAITGKDLAGDEYMAYGLTKTNPNTAGGIQSAVKGTSHILTNEPGNHFQARANSRQH